MEPTPVGAGASTPVRGAHPRRALRDLFSDLDERGIRATPRAVAAALWSFTNANGGSWPSQRRLARMTGRCERTVRSAVRELEAAGVILRRVPDLRMRRVRHATTVYRLLVGDAPPLGAQRAEPPAVLVDAAARVAALVGRELVVPVEMPEAVDLDGVPEAVELHARAPEAVELVVPVELVADPEPPSVEFLPPEAVDLDGVPELVDAVQPGARPVETSTGKGFAREDSAYLPSADLDGAPRELVDATPEEPPLVVPVAVSTRAAPSATAAEPPTRPTAPTPPPALAAAAARCAALARRR